MNEEEFWDRFSQWLFEERQKRNIACADLAAELNVHRNTVHRWENCLAKPNVWQYREIKRVFRQIHVSQKKCDSSSTKKGGAMKTTAREFQCRWTKDHPNHVEHCFKIQAEDSDFCPHHHALIDAEAEQNQKRMEKVRAAKAYKKELRDSLKDSPLAAVNPTVRENDAYSR